MLLFAQKRHRSEACSCHRITFHFRIHFLPRYSSPCPGSLLPFGIQYFTFVYPRTCANKRSASQPLPFWLRCLYTTGKPILFPLRSGSPRKKDCLLLFSFPSRRMSTYLIYILYFKSETVMCWKRYIPRLF